MHCNINYEGAFCSMQDSLSCLPSAYNTHMYMHEPYQCIFCTIGVAFSCASCTDVSDFNTEDTVTFYAGETTASFPFFPSCDTVEEGNEVVRIVLKVPEQDQHRICIIGNDHIEVVIIGKTHTTALPVPLSSVIVTVNADRNHLQITYIMPKKTDRQLSHIRLYIFHATPYNSYIRTTLYNSHTCTTLYDYHTYLMSALLSTLVL